MHSVRQVGAIAVLAWAICASAWAQSVSPIMQHYRAYQAALQADDLATAETEAAAALAASEARDGDGGRTAVLAINLASVRFQNNNATGALEPARRALALAEARGEEQTGVSPVLARMLVDRAELASGEAAAEQRLTLSLDRAVEAQILAAEIYDAASQLGAATFGGQRYGGSQRAWSIAAEYAEGSRFGEVYGRATAQTWRAAAMVLEERQEHRRASRMDEAVAGSAFVLLNEAQGALEPLAEVNSDGAVTRAQRSYALALAWRAIVRAKMSSDGYDIPGDSIAQGDADGLSEVSVPQSLTSQPRCLVTLDVRNGASRLYPRDALEDNALGGVAAQIRIDATGRVVSVEPLAVVGPESFGESISRSEALWRVERREDSPPNCRMSMTVIRSIAFVLG